MIRPEDLIGEIEALRERISALSAAILRINASLDLPTVLQEAIDSACALTGARYGGIVAIDEAGDSRDFVTSGFTAEEERQLAEWPGGRAIFEHLRDLADPLRLADLPDYLHERGFSAELARSKTFYAMPMHKGGEQVGYFCVAEKVDAREFTDEDEEVLALFASQAATAIVNARAHRDVRRARADLEALIETSPVGVLVYDAKTGRLVSFNREVRRILEGVGIGDRAPEDLLEVLRCRLPDGRDVALAEFPMAQALSAAETLRAEEIVLSVPDGRSVRALINVTPIRDEREEIVAVVVTMQDLAPLEEMERLRAEFLGMVSHELRAPLAAVKGSAAAALGGRVVPRAELLQFFRIVDAQADRMQGLVSDLVDAGRIEAGMLSVDPEPSEVAVLVEGARSTFLGSGARHAVHIDLPDELPRVMADRERIVQVLNNLLANAASHSSQAAPIAIEASLEGTHVAVSVRDRGRGIAPEMLGRLFRKHAALAGAAAGPRLNTGLGLAICKGLVEAHGGRIFAESPGPGRGARFTFTLPATGAEGARARSAASVSRGGQPAEKPRILVVDDDPQTLRHVRGALNGAGYETLVTGDPTELAGLVRNERPRLVLLDLVLPGVDGIELMERIPELSDVPVVFISGYGRDEIVARALAVGAEDYIVKPFSPTELVARVAVALRRREGSGPFALGDLAIDYETRRVTLGARPVELTATEYKLLHTLSVNAGRVVTIDSLFHQAWSGRKPTDSSQAVRAFVRKLRAKLGDDATDPVYILNERGVGYRMARPEDG